VEQAIAEYFQEVYGGSDQQADSDEDLVLWSRLEAAAEIVQRLFTITDVEEAMKASNFNKGLGPDGFDGTILRPGDPSHRLTQEVTAQILSLLNDPASIPKYLYEGRHPTNCGEVAPGKDPGEGHHGEGGHLGSAPPAN